MVFVYTAMGVLCVEHANELKLCYIELLSGDGSFRLFSLALVGLEIGIYCAATHSETRQTLYLLSCSAMIR